MLCHKGLDSIRSPSRNLHGRKCSTSFNCFFSKLFCKVFAGTDVIFSNYTLWAKSSTGAKSTQRLLHSVKGNISKALSNGVVSLNINRIECCIHKWFQ